MFPNYACARILIDGRPFDELVSAYADKVLAGNKESKLAENYWYLHPNALIEYLEGDGFGDTHRIALLGCTCLDEDCWPLLCIVEARKLHDLVRLLSAVPKTLGLFWILAFCFRETAAVGALDNLKIQFKEIPLKKD